MQINEELVAEFVADCQKQALEFVESGRRAKRVKISKTSRDLIYQSIGEKCPTCDLTLSEPSVRKSPKSYDPIDSSITLEHLLPLELGGNNSFNNLAPMCYACNVKARRAAQQEFVEALIKENRGKYLSEENKDILNRFVEWSIRTVKSPDNKIDSEFQQYFEDVGQIRAIKKSRRLVRIILVERKIAELEVRIQVLENTLWKRTMRTIGKFFQRVKSSISSVEKASTEKKASKPQKENPHKLENDIEEFRSIITEILTGADDKITMTTLGRRFSKRVQNLGFDNKKEFFKQVGIRPNISISTAINEYMSEEVTLEDGHASLNRRN